MGLTAAFDFPNHLHQSAGLLGHDARCSNTAFNRNTPIQEAILICRGPFLCKIPPHRKPELSDAARKNVYVQLKNDLDIFTATFVGRWPFTTQFMR
jgi:hypothetical protein